ncbi:MAG: hypothetical protein ACT4NY_16350 [Pseudonocardiales bacterium]
MFEPVTVPGRGEDLTAVALRSEIGAWVRSAPMRALVARFGGRVNESELPALLQGLDEFSADTWDFRANRERNLIDPDIVTGESEELILAAADALGLVRPELPMHESYDHLLILGGLVRACVRRPEYAAHLLAHSVTSRTVAALTGFRLLGGDEPSLLEAFGLPAATFEHEVVEAGLRRAFGLGPLAVEHKSPDGVLDNSRSLVAAGSTTEGVRVGFVVAPSLEPEKRRANSSDTYRFWAEEVAHPKPGERVLLVTSCIYVPYQHAEAVRLLGLPHGCELDTVGTDSRVIGDGGHVQAFRGVHYLQELRSAIRSYRALLLALRAP